MNVSTQENFMQFGNEIIEKHVIPMYTRLRKANKPEPRSIKERRRQKLDVLDSFDLYKAFDPYVRELFVNYGFTKEAIDKLRYITVYLNINEIPNHFTNNGIKEIEYYQHHIESYHIKFASIIDFILILTNHACQIGLQKRKVSIHRLNENEHFKELAVSKSIAKMLKEFDDLLQKRHELIHQGKLKHKSIEEIDREINLESMLNRDKERINLFGGDKAKTIQNTIEIFRKQTDLLENHFSLILLDLIKIIERQIKIKDLIND